MRSLLSLQQVSKSYDRKEILKDLSFEVFRSDRIGIIGANGSGKTTLIRILNLLELPDSGSLQFSGVDVRDVKDNYLLRRKMGVVFQRPAVLNTSVYGNIAAGLKIRGEKRDSIDLKVNTLLETLGLRELWNRHARILSGGEKQLLALGRAIIYDPEILLLDEPTSNLDSDNKEIFQTVLHKVKSAIIITSPIEDFVLPSVRTLRLD